jgi:hypothetical protein
MRRKALLADGTEVGLPVCDAEDVKAVVANARGPEVEEQAMQEDLWLALEIGLLRDLCGATVAEAAKRTATSASGASRRYAKHQRCLTEDESYAMRTAQLAIRALERSHGLREEALRCLRGGVER